MKLFFHAPFARHLVQSKLPPLSLEQQQRETKRGIRILARDDCIDDILFQALFMIETTDVVDELRVVY